MLEFFIVVGIAIVIASLMGLYLNSCTHQYEIINKIPKEEIIRDEDDGHVLCTNKCMIYVQRCKSCGKLKHYIVK